MINKYGTINYTKYKQMAYLKKMPLECFVSLFLFAGLFVP